MDQNAFNTDPPPSNRLLADTYLGASGLPGTNSNTPEIVIDRHPALTPLPVSTKNTPETLQEHV